MAAGQAPHTGPGAGECAGREAGDKGPSGREASTLISHLHVGKRSHGLKWDQTHVTKQSGL